MRRWNGWIDEEAAPPHVADEARRMLEAEIGQGHPTPDARLEQVLANLPPSRLAGPRADDRGGGRAHRAAVPEVRRHALPWYGGRDEVRVKLVIGADHVSAMR